MMHGHEESDPAIVAVKPANNAERSATESVERRAGTKGNADQQSTCLTQSWTSVSQALERIRHITAVDTRGGSRMRESRTYGSVRGARGNSRPYRESTSALRVVMRLENAGILTASITRQADLGRNRPTPSLMDYAPRRLCRFRHLRRRVHPRLCHLDKMLAILF
jgi:hypothetical protein